MKSLELIEELNKILINADKKCDIVYANAGEQDRLKSDIEHELLNTYKDMKAKDERECLKRIYECLTERHNYKYEYRELEILKKLYNTQGLKRALDETISNLRKLDQEIQTPIYHKRAKQNKGEVIMVNK